MPTYKTPGVFVEEISTLPPSVAEVATAIPAFIGCTEKGPKLARINTMLEFRELFGSASPTEFDVTTSTDASSVTTVQSVKPKVTSPDPAYLMYYCLEMYFRNGGGACYVASVGNYAARPAKKDFTDAITSLEKEDEPTLIVLTDAVNMSTADDYYAICNTALDHCGKMKDRFAILDVLTGDSKGAAFRGKVTSSHLMYGAAYTPYLQTDLNYEFDETKVNISAGGATTTPSWEAPHGQCH